MRLSPPDEWTGIGCRERATTRDAAGHWRDLVARADRERVDGEGTTEVFRLGPRGRRHDARRGGVRARARPGALRRAGVRARRAAARGRDRAAQAAAGGAEMACRHLLVGTLRPARAYVWQVLHRRGARLERRLRGRA